MILTKLRTLPSEEYKIDENHDGRCATVYLGSPPKYDPLSVCVMLIGESLTEVEMHWTILRRVVENWRPPCFYSTLFPLVRKFVTVI